jgi:uncharacterized protein (DUF58 family)
MNLTQTLKSLWDPTADLQIATAPDTDEKPNIYLKRLQIQLHRRLGSPYPGEYRGIFKGHGMDLQNLREYQPGDEVRKIDWNVLARTGVPHVKEHYEEKQVPIWFFVDATAPMRFGQRTAKLAYAKTLISYLGLLALESGHRVGLILWQGERTPQFVKPRPNLAQLQWMIHEIDAAMAQDAVALETDHFPDIAAFMQNRCLVFLLSDFTFLTTVRHAHRALTRLHPKHQVKSLLLVDPVEEELIYHHGWLPVSDGTPGGALWINTDDRWMIKAYRKQFHKQFMHKQHLLSPWSRCHRVNTQIDPLEQVVQLVKTHGH